MNKSIIHIYLGHYLRAISSAFLRIPPSLTSDKGAFFKVNLCKILDESLQSSGCPTTRSAHYSSLLCVEHPSLDPSVELHKQVLFSHNTHGLSQSCFVHKEPPGAAFCRRSQLEFYGLSGTSVNV